MSRWLYENNFKNFLKNFRKDIVNIHPSLLPKFKGLNTFKEFLKIMKKTGCTVHFVNENWMEENNSEKEFSD